MTSSLQILGLFFNKINCNLYCSIHIVFNHLTHVTFCYHFISVLLFKRYVMSNVVIVVFPNPYYLMSCLVLLCGDAEHR